MSNIGFAIANERRPSPHAALTILWIRRWVKEIPWSLAHLIRGERAEYVVDFRVQGPA
jgi:hypothetical protein